MVFLTGADQDSTWKKSEGPDATFAFVQLALGLYLMFGTRGLIMLITNARHLGRDIELQSQENGTDGIPFRPEN